MNLKKLLALAAALTLMLAIAACGTPATNHDDAYTTVTTEAPTLPPEEVVDFSRVFVDGVNVPGAQILIDEDYFPSHVELMPVLQALGLNHTWDEMTHEVTIGDDISFTAGVDYETVLDVGVLFVPLGFVREVLQIPGVSVESGEVQIRTHVVEDDMF